MNAQCRKNGFEKPFHLFQITSWVLIGFNTLFFYCFTLACLEKEARIGFGVVHTVFLVATVLIGYLLSASDPTDSTVILFKTSKDKELIKIVEEKSDKYCNFCKSPVGNKCRHCVRCNRCVEGFDHHCKWVNNCIGIKNYKIFFALILACFGLVVILCSSSGYLIVLWQEGNERIQRNFNEFYTADSVVAVIVFEFFVLFQNGIVVGFLGYLIGLHIMLCYKGITTFEFIARKKKKNVVFPSKVFETSSGFNSSGFHNKGAHEGKEVDDLKLTARELSLF